jgi:MoxR-like ATPase
MKPSELIESLKLLVSIQRPAFITGDAGVGKSRIVRQVAEGRDRVRSR